MTKKSKIEQLELLTVVPNGDLRFHADTWEKIFTNGKIMSGDIPPDQKMIDNIQKNIVGALAKIDEYRAELVKAQELMATVVPHESYDKLQEDFNKKLKEQNSSSPKLK